MTDDMIKVGAKLPTVDFGPITRATLALYAGASGDHNPAHIDIDFVKKIGLTDVFAHGMLSFGVLARVVTEWQGIAQLRSFGARFVSITQVHDQISCTGEIIDCFEQEGEKRARVLVAAATQDGRQTLLGEAVVALT